MTRWNFSGLFKGAWIRSVLLPAALLLLVAACDSVEERVEGHYERGQELLAEGAPEKAVLEFQNALQLDDKHVPSLFAIAQILETRGDFQGAFARYGKVSELDPTNALARLKLARFYALGNAFDKAKTELAESLKHGPDQADAHALAAVIAMREGDDAAAAKALETARGLAPMNQEVLLAEIALLRQKEGAAQALSRADEALEAHPKVLAFYVLKLQMLEEQNDQAGLGEHLAKMIETFPDEPRFRQARAQWAFKNKDLETAEKELRAIVTANPENREAVTTLIRFLLTQHGRETARAELTGLIESTEDAVPLEMMLAQFDIQTGQTQAAIAFLRDLIGRAGDQANEARILLARLLVREGEREEAYTLVDTVLENDQNNVEALTLHTARLIDAGRLDDALQAVRRGLAEAPEDLRLLNLAGRTHERMGNLNLASDRFAKAVRTSEYDPANVERYVQFLRRANRAESALTVVTEAAERRKDDPRILDLLASLQLNAGDWNGAETTIAALEKLNPDRARQLHGALMLGQERFDEGREALRDLPEDERQQAVSIAALVQTYIRERKFDEAKAFLDELLAKNPKNLQAIGLRGMVLQIDGDRDGAKAAFQSILEIDPNNAGAHVALARLAQRGGDNEEAERILLAGLEKSGENPVMLTHLAALKERDGDVDAAIGYYERLYNAAPDSLIAANNLAAMLTDHRAGNPDEIERAYRIAGRLRNATQPAFRDTYGWSRYLRGEHKEALEHLTAAAEGLPDNPWVLYHLGMTHAALEQPAEARKHLEAALKLAGDTDFPPAAEIRETLAGLN